MADRHGIGAHRQRLGDIGAGANAAGDDKLHFALHIQVFQCIYRLAQCCQGRNADVFDEHGLCGGGAALHAVDHDHVRPGVHRELDVVEGARRADLHIDRLLPIGDFAQLLYLDRQVIRPGPVGMPAGGALIHAFGKHAHFRYPWINLLTEKHAAAARLGALSDHDFDRIGAAHIVWLESIARRQALINERLRRPAFLFRHAPVARGGRCPHFTCRAPERFLDVSGKRTEAHAGDRDRNGELDRLARKSRPQHGPGHAFFAIAFQRVARQRCAEENQVVEMRHMAFRAKAADLIEPGRRGVMHVVDDLAVETRALFELQAVLWFGSLIHVVTRTSNPNSLTAEAQRTQRKCKEKHNHSQ